MTIAAASGPARSRRSSAAPAAAIASISRSVSSSTGAVKRSRTAPSRNGPANGARWRLCASPSSVSMLGPTTWPVEKRGSSTVNVAGSRITCIARSRRETSQPSSAGSHDTGSRSRSRASSGCGSVSSSASVAAAPSGNSRARIRSATAAAARSAPRSRRRAARPCNSHAASTPPTAPNRWPCHEMPSSGTSPRSSVVPQTASTATPTAICMALRL